MGLICAPWVMNTRKYSFDKRGGGVRTVDIITRRASIVGISRTARVSVYLKLARIT